MDQGGWVKLQADDYEAIVSTRSLMAQPDSMLSQMCEMELQRNPSSPTIRLDASAEVARELVACLRHGSSYVPPSEPRLLKALKHLLDFLGVVVQAASDAQEYLVVPSYDVDYSSGDGRMSVDMFGMLMYSSAARGWANMTCDADPRPKDMRVSKHEDTAVWQASVLRAEHTGAGEDIIYLINNDVGGLRGGGVALKVSSMKCSDCASVPSEFNTVCDASVCSARDKVYMLGGEALTRPPSTFFRVYDSHIDTWFQAASPIATPETLVGSVLVSNQPEGMLLSIGGYINEHEEPSPATMTDRVAVYDINGGRWSINPSGCTWPGAARSGRPHPREDRSSVSATAVDQYTIMVVGGFGGEEVRVDLLDLRTWRWREGAPLRRQGTDSRNVSVVVYEGKVLALGGKRARGEDGELQKVYSYDPAANSWGHDSAVARLPVGLTKCSPVVVRMAR